MPTMNPRITFTVSEETMNAIDEYKLPENIRGVPWGVGYSSSGGSILLYSAVEMPNSAPRRAHTTALVLATSVA